MCRYKQNEKLASSDRYLTTLETFLNPKPHPSKLNKETPNVRQSDQTNSTNVHATRFPGVQALNETIKGRDLTLVALSRTCVNRHRDYIYPLSSLLRYSDTPWCRGPNPDNCSPITINSRFTRARAPADKHLNTRCPWYPESRRAG